MACPPPPPGSVVPPTTTPAALASAARHCEALRRAHRLATWVGEGKPVTAKHVLRPRDVPAAAQALGVVVSSRINTAADVPALHRPWTVALAIGFLRIVDGDAVAGPALGQWPHTDDDTVGERWLAGLVTAFATGAGKDDHASAIAFSHIVLAALATDSSRPVLEPWTPARDALSFDDWYIADPFITAYRHKYGDPFAAISDVLLEFGAATHHGAQLVLTPLGRWALQQTHARMPKPISAELPADELIARVAGSGEHDAWYAAQPWLTGRAALPAAREILAAAARATPAHRIAAVEIVEALGEPAHTLWRDVTTVPSLAAHARLALTGWGRLPALGSWGLGLARSRVRDGRQLVPRHHPGKVLDLEVGARYPVCVTGRGDFPIEYWNDEDDGQKSIPFDKDKINNRLVKLARR